MLSQPWYSCPLDVSLDFFTSHKDLAEFSLLWPQADVTSYFDTQFHHLGSFVLIFIASPLELVVGPRSLYGRLFTYFKCASFWLHGCCGEWIVCPVKRLTIPIGCCNYFNWPSYFGPQISEFSVDIGALP